MDLTPYPFDKTKKKQQQQQIKANIIHQSEIDSSEDEKERDKHEKITFFLFKRKGTFIIKKIRLKFYWVLVPFITFS